MREPRGWYYHTHLAVKLHELGRELGRRWLDGAGEVAVLGCQRRFRLLGRGTRLVRTQPRLLGVAQLHPLVLARALVAHRVPVAVVGLTRHIEHGCLARALLCVRLVSVAADTAQKHGRGRRRRQLVIGLSLRGTAAPRIRLAYGAQRQGKCGERRGCHGCVPDKPCGKPLADSNREGLVDATGAVTRARTHTTTLAR